MKNMITKGLLASLLTLLALPQNAQAVPAFARQMNMECISCHNQNIPKLNAFGRQFKLSGFTMSSQTGTQSLISGSTLGLSLPSVLNIAFITKARYHLTNGKETAATQETVGSSRGNLEIFDESALFFGGRVSDNVGASVEFGAGLLGGKFIFAQEVYGGNAGIAYFTTDALGAFAGMELYNTGLYRPIRQFENRKGTNAAQVTGVGDGAATGIQAYYGGHNLFVTVGLYGPAQNGNPGLDTGGDLIPFYRLGAELPVYNWTLMLGTYGMKGKAILSDAAIDGLAPGSATAHLVGIERKTYGFDLQAEGTLADMNTLITANAVVGNAVDYTDETNSSINLSGNNIDNRAGSLEMQVNPVNDIGLKAAYLLFDNKLNDAKDFSAYSAGVDYLYRQNVRFVLEYTYSDPKPAGTKSYSDIYLMSMIAF